MDLRELGTPAQLWRRWVLLAAADAGRQESGYEIRRTDGCGHHADGPAWVRLRRLGGNRAVLWGHHPDIVIRDDFTEELADSAPDWSYDVDSAYARREVGFLGWHAHGSWSGVPAAVPGPAGVLLGDLASDAATLRRWQEHWPDTTPDHLADVLTHGEGPALVAVMGATAAARAGRQVALGRTWSSRQISQTATVHLRSQIHLQMRGSSELGGRGHQARPKLLRQWARVNPVRRPFVHAVCALGPATTPGFVTGAENHGLTDPQRRSLENVMMELRMAETDEASGAWLFARVVGDGESVRIERAFDCWPSWYAAPGPGPTMSSLHAEMVQRRPAWRPSWSSLLPAERF